MLDIFNSDAFSVTTLTDAVNKMPFVPGRCGELAFAGAGRGVLSTTVAIEQRENTLSLLQTSERGAPAAQNNANKRTLRNLTIPHITLEDTIPAHEIQNMRAFGSEMATVFQTEVNQRLADMVADHDLTLENLRFGALKGIILDADGSTIYNLFTEFGVTQEAEVDFELDDSSTDVRGKCATVIRTMKRNMKMGNNSSMRVWALCSDSFFDALISHANVAGAYDGYAAAERRLGESYAHGVFEFGGIFFENYQGTDDNSTVAVATDKVHMFPVGVPGLFREYYAPGDFVGEVNTIGLPRYARIARDPEFDRWVKIHTQQNPLPICTRPKVLMKGKRA